MLKRNQFGLTLVELLIGLLVGSVVVGAGITIYTNSIKSGTDNVKLIRLNQDLRAMMDIMVRDIRRAGFVTSFPDTNSSDIQINPFLDSTTAGATTDIVVYDYDGGNLNCIVYSYNRDNDSPVTVDNNERFGFRLDSNNELKMRTSGTTNEDCVNTAGAWETITEPEVAITGLTFTLNQSTLNVTSMMFDTDNNGRKDGDDNGNGTCDSGEVCNTCITGQACLYVRDVIITLTGQLRDDSTVSQTINEQVKVRNDKYLASAP